MPSRLNSDDTETTENPNAPQEYSSPVARAHAFIRLRLEPILYNRNPIMNTDIHRDRGVLTEADRAYLLGETEMTHEQSKRNAEARIRQRITNAIFDFDLIVHMLADKDRRQVFERAATDDELLDGVTAMLAFTALGLKEQGVELEDVLVPAIRSAEEAYAASQLAANVSVDITFDVETAVESTFEGIEARLTDGDPVRPRELFSLAIERGHDLTVYDRITLVRTEDDGADDEFVERLAEYLGGDLRQLSESRAEIDLGRTEQAGERS